MPVRSSSSPVFKWPDAHTVQAALADWATAVVESSPEVALIGYFGSYARGDWGVGSDVDIVVVVKESAARFEERALRFPAHRLPVPADVLVFTEDEWRAGLRRPGIIRTANDEVAWVYDAGESRDV